MGFIKLPSNSEKVLLKLAHSDNPTETLCSLYETCSPKDRHKLDGIVRELKECGYITTIWADNMPWVVTLNNSARTYEEQLAEYESQHAPQKPQETKVNPIIFISHRSTDKDIADMLIDFFCGTGIPKDAFFCSSLPSNDVNEKISAEVKTALKNSIVNIAILSRDYYESAYCLNEAGILWYNDDVPVIPIALPEINSNNMYGFLSNEYKLRRLNCDTDISFIYDVVSEAVSVPSAKASIITCENNKLRSKYDNYINTREIPVPVPKIQHPITISELTTDDEQIVLYYLLQHKVRKVSKSTIARWLIHNEIYDVNIDNAFDLLSSFAGGNINGDTLEFGLEHFRKYTVNTASVLPELKKCVDQHTHLASDAFFAIWLSDELPPYIKLFTAYIIDERMKLFGNRWKSEEQTKHIRQWELNNSLDSTLSSHYGSCLEFFILNNFVYESDWTSHGNPREYTLHHSLQDFLFNHSAKINGELQTVMDDHYSALPF